MIIGKGTYGVVLQNELNNNQVIKKFEDFDTFIKELFYLSFFKNCKNICQIVDYNLNDNTITMDKYDYNLYDFSYKIPFSKRIELITTIIDQILNGLEQIHRRNIIHGDLLSKNIFCNYRDNTIECFVGDFSLTSIFGFSRNDNKNILFPKDSILDTKFDIWTLGIIIYEFLFHINLDPKLFKHKFDQSYLNPFKIREINSINIRLIQYIERITTIDKNKRLGFEISDPLCINYLDLFRKLNKYIFDEDLSYYIAHNVLFYSAMQSNNYQIDEYIKKIKDINLLNLFESFNNDKTYKKIDIINNYIFDYEINNLKYIKKNDKIIIINNDYILSELLKLEEIKDEKLYNNYLLQIINFIYNNNVLDSLKSNRLKKRIYDYFKNYIKYNELNNIEIERYFSKISY